MLDHDAIAADPPTTRVDGVDPGSPEPDGHEHDNAPYTLVRNRQRDRGHGRVHQVADHYGRERARHRDRDQNRHCHHNEPQRDTTTVYRFTVRENDVDLDGVSIEADSLSLRSGASMVDSAQATTCVLGYTWLFRTMRSHPVDGIRPRAGTPAISSTPANGSSYGVGETIEVTIPLRRGRYRQRGSPTSGTLDLGFARSMTLTAGGSGTERLTFGYRLTSRRTSSATELELTGREHSAAGQRRDRRSRRQ